MGNLILYKAKKLFSNEAAKAFFLAVATSPPPLLQGGLGGHLEGFAMPPAPTPQLLLLLPSPKVLLIFPDY